MLNQLKRASFYCGTIIKLLKVIYLIQV